MIMTVTLVVKILLPVAVIAIGWRMLRKKVSSGGLIAIAVMVAAFAAAANVVAGMLLPLKDVVVLTALGEKNETALADEVFLSGYTVDGKAYLCGEDLEIYEGKWGWIADVYGWRPEIDLRQPQGVTDSISIGIPVGANRTLEFEGDIWRGLVEISAGGRVWTFDTYSDPAGTVSEPIGGSETAKLVWDQVRTLLVYAAVFAALTAAAWFLWKPVKEHRAEFKRHYDVILEILLGVFMFVMMRYYHKFNDMVWGDDWQEINYIIQGTLKQALQGSLLLWDMTPPLFTTIAWVINKVFRLPHTTGALFLLPQAFLCLTVLVMGFLGREITGKKWCGVLAAILTATSASLVLTAGYEVRTYSMYCFAAAATLLVYIKSLRAPRFSIKLFIPYTLCLTAVMNSHYIGITVIGMYFLSDFYLSCKKRRSWKWMLAIVLPVLSIALWIVAVICAKGVVPSRPTTPWGIKGFFELAQYFAGGHPIVFISLAALFAWLLVNFRDLWNKVEATQIPDSNYIELFMVVSIVLDIAAVEIASFIFSISNYRYLICLLPLILLLIVCMTKRTADLIGERYGKLNGRQSAAVLLTLFLVLFAGMNEAILSDMGAKSGRIVEDPNNSRMLYMDIIDLLKDQPDIHARNTGIFSAYKDAYQWFFDGRYSDVNFELDYDQEAIEKYDTIYYVYYDWAPVNLMSSYETIQEHFEVVQTYPWLCVIKYQRTS